MKKDLSYSTSNGWKRQFCGGAIKSKIYFFLFIYWNIHPFTTTNKFIKRKKYNTLIISNLIIFLLITFVSHVTLRKYILVYETQNIKSLWQLDLQKNYLLKNCKHLKLLDHFSNMEDLASIYRKLEKQILDIFILNL